MISGLFHEFHVALVPISVACRATSAGPRLRCERRHGVAYPAISGFHDGAEADPDWINTYPGTEKVCRSALGKRVIRESYDGVLIDEYQDCSLKQHALVSALGDCIPCRGVGDPLQTVFGFRDDPVVPWTTITTDFDVLDCGLRDPGAGAGRATIRPSETGLSRRGVSSKRSNGS